MLNYWLEILRNMVIVEHLSDFSYGTLNSDSLLVGREGGGLVGGKIVFDFLIVNGAIYQKTSTFGNKSLLPAQKQCVSL